MKQLWKEPHIARLVGRLLLRSKCYKLTLTAPVYRVNAARSALVLQPDHLSQTNTAIGIPLSWGKRALLYSKQTFFSETIFSS
jgi:hypothetical protein